MVGLDLTVEPFVATKIKDVYGSKDRSTRIHKRSTREQIPVAAAASAPRGS